MNSPAFAEKMEKMGQTVFGGLIGFLGLSTGGAGFALLGTMSSLLGNAALDYAKSGMEEMMYKEVAKEVSGNMFDIIFKKCIYERLPKKSVAWSATMDELAAPIEGAKARITQEALRLAHFAETAGDYFGSVFGGGGGAAAGSFAEHQNRDTLLPRITRRSGLTSSRTGFSFIQMANQSKAWEQHSKRQRKRFEPMPRVSMVQLAVHGRSLAHLKDLGGISLPMLRGDG